MEVTLFHGGKDIDKTYRYGYQPSGGKDRYEYGAGLYLTAANIRNNHNISPYCHDMD